MKIRGHCPCTTLGGGGGGGVAAFTAFIKSNSVTKKIKNKIQIIK
jgi:hypothetical protein